MGTDIHLYVEKKINDRWRYQDGELFVWRDYDVFSRLCGVRKADPWHGIAREPRGYPDNLSPLVSQYMSENPDFHSASWISDQEFLQEFPWQGKLETMSHFAIVCYAYIWCPVYPLRFVFAFDC